LLDYCSKLNLDGFATQCGGVRANVGVTSGKFYFIVKLLRAAPLSEDALRAIDCFLGVSERGTDVGLLGVVPHSFAVSSSGYLLTGGRPCGINDWFISRSIGADMLLILYYG
jgi:hypothetical protein